MAAPLPPDLDIGFRYLFGDKEFQITDASVTQVKDILNSPTYQGGLCGFTETQDRASSNVRFYCDEDPQDPTAANQRWTLVPDIDGDEKPNSERKRDEQEFEDKLNNIRMNTASKGCLDVDNKGELDTEAELHHTIPTEPDPNQNPLRTVVTLCAKTFKGSKRTLSDFDGDDLEALTLKDFSDDFLFVVIWHELMHFPPWFRYDLKNPSSPIWGTRPSNSGPFGWDDIIHLLQNQKLLNADNHAFWGLLCGLHDKGWRLSIYDYDGNISLDEVEEGILVYDEAIFPQRQVRRRGNAVLLGPRQPMIKPIY